VQRERVKLRGLDALQAGAQCRVFPLLRPRAGINESERHPFAVLDESICWQCKAGHLLGKGWERFVSSNATKPILCVPVIRLASVHDPVEPAPVRRLNLLGDAMRCVEMIVPEKRHAPEQRLDTRRQSGRREVTLHSILQFHLPGNPGPNLRPKGRKGFGLNHFFESIQTFHGGGHEGEATDSGEGVQRTFESSPPSATLREASTACKRDAVLARVYQQLCQESRMGLALALILAWSILGAQAASVTTSVDRPAIALGESVTLSLSLQGANIGQPSLPAIPNVRVVGTSTSFSFDTARGAAQQTFTYQLVPNQVGNYVIPAFQIRVGTEMLITQPISFKVVQPGDSVMTPGAPMPTAFVRLVTPKNQLYLGELSEVQVQVYFQEGRLTQYPQLPADSGFTVGKWLKPIETRATISNQLYNLVIFKQPITAVKTGALFLGPATVPLFVTDRTRRADFFFGRAEREMRMSSEKLALQVLPIPSENVPPTFAGAVGNFSLMVAAAPTNVAAGDPITLRVHLNGRGALEGVTLPPQPAWSEFKTYPPTSKIETTEANPASGTKVFEQVVVPERAGISVLPSLVFSFFDPDQRAFRTLTGPAIALSVRPSAGGGSALPSLPGGTNAAPAQPASDLAHIKPNLGAAAPASLFVVRPAFLILQLIPPAAWLAVVFWRRRRDRLANNPGEQRRLEVSHKVRRGLGELQTQAVAKDSDAFFATVLRLLQEQIGERIDLPSNAITEAVISERLAPAGAPEPLCASLHELFQMCNLARYAPVKSSPELFAIIPKVQLALSELRAWKPAKS
jgi:hypothetical protein